MRRRPLFAAFLVLILLIVVFKEKGMPLWGCDFLTEEQEKSLNRVLFTTGTITDRRWTKNGCTYILSDVSVRCASETVTLRKIRIPSTEEQIRIGTRIRAKGRVDPFPGASNPGGYDAAAANAAEGVRFRLRMKSFTVLAEPEKDTFRERAAQLRERICRLFEENMGEEYGSILSAMLLGEKSSLNEETRINYSVSGLSHLLAISGLHVGILGMLLLQLFLRLRIPKKAALPAVSVLLAFYCGFTGNHDSTLRAFVMFSVMAGAGCFLRSYDMLSSLSAAGILLLLHRPERLFHAGFILSFAAAAALGILYPVLRRTRLFQPLKPAGFAGRIRSRSREGLAVWLCVNAVTIPFVLWYYGEMPVYGVLANILFVPMTSALILLGLGGAALALAFPKCAPIVLWVPKMITAVQDRAGEVLRNVPGSVWISGRPDGWRLGFYFAGLTILFLWLRIHSGTETPGTAIRKNALVPVLSAVLMLLILVRPYHPFSITALDVGQGDGFVITDGGGGAYLMDGGSSSTDSVGGFVILPYLKNQGIAVLDGVFVSHNDADHMNGILEMLQKAADRTTAVRIRSLYLPFWMKEEETGMRLAEAAEKAGTDVRYLSAGDSFVSGQISGEILAPEADSEAAGNEGSLVLGLQYGGFRALFTGDLEGEPEQELCERLEHYDYLKVAHHGSSHSTPSEFLDAVTPELCIISAPENSIYGHPGKDTLQRIEASGARWLQTGLCGAVRVRAGEGCFYAETWRY